MKYIILTKRGLTAITAVTFIRAAYRIRNLRQKKAHSALPLPRRANGFCPSTALRRAKKKVAVTFDAAWGADDTERLIEILKNHNAKATFFVVGEWAENIPTA